MYKKSFTSMHVIIVNLNCNRLTTYGKREKIDRTCVVRVAFVQILLMDALISSVDLIFENWANFIRVDLLESTIVRTQCFCNVCKESPPPSPSSPQCWVFPCEKLTVSRKLAKRLTISLNKKLSCRA